MHPNYTHRGLLALERRRAALARRKALRRGKHQTKEPTSEDTSRALASYEPPRIGPGRARVRAHDREQAKLVAAPWRAYFEGRRTAAWHKWRAHREATLAEFFKALSVRSDEELLQALEKEGALVDVLAFRAGVFDREEACRIIARKTFPHPVYG